MKALRLPTRVSTVAYWFASAAHAIPPLVRVSPWRSWKLGDSLPGPGLLLLPAALLRLLSREREWGSLRSPDVPSRAVAVFQDPGRIDVSSPLTATSMLPPFVRQRRLRR